MLFKGLNKLSDTQVLSPGPFNILAVPKRPFDIPIITLASFEALPRVYSNKKIQEIISIIIETRPATTKSL